MYIYIYIQIIQIHDVTLWQLNIAIKHGHLYIVSFASKHGGSFHVGRLHPIKFLPSNHH